MNNEKLKMKKGENVLILPQLLIINCNSLLTFNF